MLAQQQSAAQFLEESQKKDMGGDRGQVAFFNNRLVSDLDLSLTAFWRVQDINRFFIDEGDSSDVPQVFFSKNTADEQLNDNQNNLPNQSSDDLFEEQLDNALQVFKSGGANTDLLKENEGQILFYVDLDNEAIIERNEMEDEKDEDDDGEREIGERPHPMLFNQYPLCQAHSLFLLFAEHSFPQVLSNELIQLLL